jgi:hypothetical protein
VGSILVCCGLPASPGRKRWWILTFGSLKPSWSCSSMSNKRKTKGRFRNKNRLTSPLSRCWKTAKRHTLPQQTIVLPKSLSTSYIASPINHNRALWGNKVLCQLILNCECGYYSDWM